MKRIQKSWEAYRKMCVPHTASETQLSETRQAYFAGAAVLFKAIIASLDPGKEATEGDMRRMSELQTELDEFGASLDRKAFGGIEH